MVIKDDMALKDADPNVRIPQFLDVRSGKPIVDDLVQEIFESKHQKAIVNFIGPPGVGKSTLRTIVYRKLRRKVLESMKDRGKISSSSRVQDLTTRPDILIQSKGYDQAWEKFAKERQLTEFSMVDRIKLSLVIYNEIHQFLTAPPIDPHQKEVLLYEYPAMPFESLALRVEERAAITLLTLIRDLQAERFNALVIIQGLLSDNRNQQYSAAMREEILELAEHKLYNLIIPTLKDKYNLVLENPNTSPKDIVRFIEQTANSSIIEEINGYIRDAIEEFYSKGDRNQEFTRNLYEISGEVLTTFLSKSIKENEEVMSRLAYMLTYFQQTNLSWEVARIAFNPFIFTKDQDVQLPLYLG